MDSNPICYPSQAKNSEMLIFVLHSTSDVGQTGQWTQTPSTTPLQPIKWNAHFWITFNFWWSAGLVDGLEPHPPPVSCQKMKCTYFDYVQLLMIGQAGQWTQTPSATPLQPKKWNAHFCITFNFWWLAGLSDGLKPHPPSLSSQKNEMLIFGLHSTFDDWLGWSMDSNPICHLSPAKKMKSSFLYYVELLMISWAGWWTRTPSTSPLHPKNEMLIFGLCSTSDDQLGCSMDSNPSSTSLQPKKMKCSFFDPVQLLMISWAGQWT